MRKRTGIIWLLALCTMVSTSTYAHGYSHDSSFKDYIAWENEHPEVMRCFPVPMDDGGFMFLTEYVLECNKKLRNGELDHFSAACYTCSKSGITLFFQTVRINRSDLPLFCSRVVYKWDNSFAFTYDSEDDPGIIRLDFDDKDGYSIETITVCIPILKPSLKKPPLLEWDPIETSSIISGLFDLAKSKNVTLYLSAWGVIEEYTLTQQEKECFAAAARGLSSALHQMND